MAAAGQYTRHHSPDGGVHAPPRRVALRESNGFYLLWQLAATQQKRNIVFISTFIYHIVKLHRRRWTFRREQSVRTIGIQFIDMVKMRISAVTISIRNVQQPTVQNKNVKCRLSTITKCMQDRPQLHTVTTVFTHFSQPLKSKQLGFIKKCDDNQDSQAFCYRYVLYLYTSTKQSY